MLRHRPTACYLGSGHGAAPPRPYGAGYETPSSWGIAACRCTQLAFEAECFDIDLPRIAWVQVMEPLLRALMARVMKLLLRGEYESTKQQKKEAFRLPLRGNRQRPILPGRVQPSTFGTGELNYCVRYGNRWDLSVITTGRFSRFCTLRCTLTTAQIGFNIFRPYN